jgi:peptide/nickel transport system ATP-binding protein
MSRSRTLEMRLLDISSAATQCSLQPSRAGARVVETEIIRSAETMRCRRGEGTVVAGQTEDRVAVMSAPGDAAAPTAADTLLAVRDLCVSFRGASGWLQVLDDVSLTVQRGETVAIVGESGCGKSLTALSILGLLPRRDCRRTGEILFEGRDIASLGDTEMRQVRGRRIGMIFQEPMSALDPVFTVGDQISETVRAHLPVSRREARERAVGALAAVGIPSPRYCAGLYPISLSGGMRQRVMIAMALVCAPRLLIADEPTTALDVTIQAQIMDLLLELGSRTGIAILFITHNLGLVAGSCTRMLTMYAGQVVEGGPVDDILQRPLHPYTAGLLASLPHQAAHKARLSSIPGRVPSPSEMPHGCRFFPRCAHAEDACREPQASLAAGERRVRCRRYDALTLSGAVA